MELSSDVRALSGHQASPLIAATPPGWAKIALADIDEFLLDHASCERKAAASAMGLIARHSGFAPLVEPLVTLAREELDHFAQVFRHLQRRGLVLGPDPKDPYVNRLLAGTRAEPEVRLLDRLLASALIEARSCERFQLVHEELAAQAAPDREMVAFYHMLWRAEAGHFRVFVRIAERLYRPDVVADGLARLQQVEAEAMLGTPFRCAVH